MSGRRLSSLEKIGYIRKLPKDANLNDYESITIKSKDGKKITLYRNLDEKKEIDDTSNFSSSWDLFNSYLN